MVAAGSAIAATVPGLTDLEPPSDAGRMPQDGRSPLPTRSQTVETRSPGARVRLGALFSRLSQGLAFGLWRRARVGAPHRGRTTPVDERARIRRNPDPLPADAWAEYRGHRGLRWLEAERRQSEEDDEQRQLGKGHAGKSARGKEQRHPTLAMRHQQPDPRGDQQPGRGSGKPAEDTPNDPKLSMLKNQATERQPHRPRK